MVGPLRATTARPLLIGANARATSARTLVIVTSTRATSARPLLIVAQGLTGTSTFNRYLCPPEVGRALVTINSGRAAVGRALVTTKSGRDEGGRALVKITR